MRTGGRLGAGGQALTRPAILLTLLLVHAPAVAPEPVKRQHVYEAPPELMVVIKALLDASRLYRVDPELVFSVAWAESELKPWARSKRDGKVIARGLMQISLQYQDELVVKYLGWHPSAYNWRNPVHSAKLGCAYLRALIDEYGVWGAIASYNAGPGRYEQLWRGRPLPLETQRYLVKVLG